MRRNKLYVRLALLAFLVSLVFFVLMSYSLVSVSIAILSELSKTEWNSQNLQSEAFYIQCIANYIKGCSSEYSQLFEARYSWNPVYFFILSAFAAAILYTLSVIKFSDKAPGGSRWATLKDIKPLYKDNNRTPLRGYYGLYEDKDSLILRIPEEQRCEHTAVVGGQGSGKTSGINKPSILVDAQNDVVVIVFDIKYPDPNAGYYEILNWFRNLNKPVHMFTPFEKGSSSVSLLAGVDSIESALPVVDMIIPKKEDAGDSEFYENISRQLLAGMIYLTVLEGRPSIAAIHEISKLNLDDFKERIKPYPDIIKAISNAISLKKDTFVGAMAGLDASLASFENQQLAEATSMNEETDLDLKKILSTPGLFYIGIPPAYMQQESGKVILRLMKRAIDNAILTIAAQNGGQTPYHVAIYLDEFAQMGVLPNIQENFAMLRSYRVAIHVTLQNISQGYAVYGKELFDAIMDSAFGQTIIFPNAIKGQTAEFYMELLGEITVTEKRYSTTHQGIISIPSRSLAIGENSRAILSREDMILYPRGHGVLISTGYPPIQIATPRLDNKAHPLYKKYVKLSKPTKKDDSKPASNLPRVINNSGIAYHRFRNWSNQMFQQGLIKPIWNEEKRVMMIEPKAIENLTWEYITWIGLGLIIPKSEYAELTEKGLNYIEALAVQPTSSIKLDKESNLVEIGNREEKPEVSVQVRKPKRAVRSEKMGPEGVDLRNRSNDPRER